MMKGDQVSVILITIDEGISVFLNHSNRFLEGSFAKKKYLNLLSRKAGGSGMERMP